MFDRWTRGRRSSASHMERCRAAATASIAAAVQIAPGDPTRIGATGLAVSESVEGCVVRLVDDRAHLVVVPTVAVIIGDDDCSVLPVLRVLQSIDGVDEEALLV